MRVLSVLILLCLSPCCGAAATLTTWPGTDTAVEGPSQTPAFETVLAAHDISYRDAPGEPPASVPDIVLRALLLALYGLALAAFLPRGPGYAARAASAMSRMRRTIARRPFDR